MQLRIRHGTKPILRNIACHVSDAPTEIVIIGRRVLRAIGCDNKFMLAASCAKNDGFMKFPEALAADNTARASKGTTSPLVNGGAFHSGEGGALDESGVHVDTGEDPEKDGDAELEAAVKRAQRKSLSAPGANILRQLTDKHRVNFD